MLPSPSCSEQVFLNGSHAGSFSFPTIIKFISVNREEAWPHPKRKFTQSTMILFCGLPFVIPISPNEKKPILLGSFAQRSQVAPSILHVLWDQQLWMPFEARVFLILDSWEKNDMMKLPWHFWMRDRFLFLWVVCLWLVTVWQHEHYIRVGVCRMWQLYFWRTARFVDHATYQKQSCWLDQWIY